MLTGKELGAAIKVAIERKRVTQKDVAAKFGIQPPSVSDWIKRGTISKDKLPALWSYFADVCGPDHWGLTSFPGASQLVVAEAEQPYAVNVTCLPATPAWETELLVAARLLSDKGRERLIGMAQLLATDHPRVNAKAKS